MPCCFMKMTWTVHQICALMNTDSMLTESAWFKISKLMMRSWNAHCYMVNNSDTDMGRFSMCSVFSRTQYHIACLASALKHIHVIKKILKFFYVWIHNLSEIIPLFSKIIYSSIKEFNARENILVTEYWCYEFICIKDFVKYWKDT